MTDDRKYQYIDKMSLFNVILAFFIASSVAAASNTPVLIWSPNRPLSDLPQSYAGETVKDDIFTDKYLKPLTSDPSQSVVVFLQDKLSVEDFTNHADVYNPSSDGGAFKNVKSAMDDQFSVHLPAVINSKETIERMLKSFSGKVHKVDNPQELANLKMKDDEGYLIIVSLQPIKSDEEFDSFKRNDETIGKCLHHMNKRGIKYSAIYTAKSSKVLSKEVHSGRHLLAEADEVSNGTFVSGEKVNVFLKSVSVYITPKPKDANTKPVTFNTVFPFDKADDLQFEKVNESVKLTFELKSSNGSATLEMMIVQNKLFEFVSENGTFSYEGNVASANDVDDMPINYKIQATKGFCFHCTMLRAVRDYSRKDFNGTSEVNVILNGFQIEAFNPYNSSSTKYFTSDVWDCVEFFTIPIWMGIITTLLLLTILFYGITMIANITTMDRFDDPKGKTITITVNE